MNQLFYKHFYWASTHQSIYLFIIYLLPSLLNLLLAVNPNQFALEMWCLKFTVIEWWTDPSLLTVWTNQKRSLPIFTFQSININSSSDVIFQSNSTMYRPSWDLLCQDLLKSISNSNAVRLVYLLTGAFLANLQWIYSGNQLIM